MTMENLTTELENAVEKGLAQGNALGHGHQQRLVGGNRANGDVRATQQSAPLADMLMAVTEHNEFLKAHLDQAIRDLQDLRAKL